MKFYKKDLDTTLYLIKSDLASIYAVPLNSIEQYMHITDSVLRDIQLKFQLDQSVVSIFATDVADVNGVINEAKYTDFLENIEKIMAALPEGMAELRMLLSGYLISIIAPRSGLFRVIQRRMPISILVPAYNEEETIKPIIENLLQSPVAKEIIAINDGSLDETKVILGTLQHEKFIFKDVEPNQGKGNAVAVGARQASGRVVCMIDADLRSFQVQHMHCIVAPLLFPSLEIRAVLGIRGNMKKIAVGTMLTGERAYFRDDFIAVVDEIQSTRFGIETILNEHFRDALTLMVPLIGLVHPMKFEKNYSPQKMVREYFNVTSEVLQTKAKLQVKRIKKEIEQLRGLVIS